MILAGMNFGLHFFAFKERSANVYIRDDEVKFYLAILLITSCIVILALTSRPLTAPLRQPA